MEMWRAVLVDAGFHTLLETLEVAATQAERRLEEKNCGLLARM